MTVNTLEADEIDTNQPKKILIEETRENISSNLSLQENEDEENYIL